MDIEKLYTYIGKKTGCSETTVKRISAVIVVGSLAFDVVGSFPILKSFYEQAPASTVGFTLAGGIGSLHAWTLKKRGSIINRFLLEMKYAAAGLVVGGAVDLSMKEFLPPSKPLATLANAQKPPAAATP